ncbi:MAG: hypothetical protein AB7I59_09975 [Geminicoccaceae bacterium]
MEEQQPGLSLVVPAFNEEVVLTSFHRRLAAILAVRSGTGMGAVFARRIAFSGTKRRPLHHVRDYQPAKPLVRGAAHAD